MKTEEFEAKFNGEEFNFTKLPYSGQSVGKYRSGGFTYTSNIINYPDTRFLLYCDHILNEDEKIKLEEDWRRYCPD